MRLLHTADWHIGKPFAHIQGDTAAILRQARFDVIGQLANLGREWDVDAVLVAGDIFDNEQVASETILKLIVCLERFDVPCILMPGNHDPSRQGGLWQRIESFEKPPHVHLALSSEPFVFCDDKLVVLPAPLTEKHPVGDATQWMDHQDTHTSAFRVGLAHGSIEGYLPEIAEETATIDPSRAAKARLDYLALGDWHGTLKVNERTWYCGTPETDSFSRNESGNALIIELEEPGSLPKVETVSTTQFRWDQREVSFALEDSAAVANALASYLDANPQSLENTLLRLDLEGTLDLSVRASLDRFLEPWHARYRYLDVRADNLASHMRADDLAQFDRDDVLRQVATTLVEKSDDPQNQDKQIATLALQLLYTEHDRLRSGG